MRQKFKYFLENDQLYYATIVILVAVASFGLGRASISTGTTVDTPDTKVLVSRAQVNQNSIVELPEASGGGGERASDTSVGAVVASKSGTKYHLPSCSGAAQIKPENLISFASVAAAAAAGYTPAANCPGLK